MYAKNLLHQKIHLAVLDTAGIFLALVTSLILRFNVDAHTLGLRPGSAPWADYLTAAIPIIAITLICFRTAGLYHLGISRVSELLTLIKGSTVAAMVMLSITFFYRAYSFSRVTALFFYPITVVFVLAGRSLYRRFRERLFGSHPVSRRVLIVGAGKVGAYLLREMLNQPSFYHPAGFLDDDPEKIGTTVNGIEVLGPVSSLDRVVASSRIDEVIVAFPSAPHERIMEVLDRCLRLKVNWKVVPDLYDLMLDRFRVDAVGELPLLAMKGSNIVGFNYGMKRSLDILVSGSLLFVLGLPMLIMAALVRMTSRGPALYRQTRIGYQGAEFEFLKFRTMFTQNDPTIHQEYTKLWIEGKTGTESPSNSNGARRTSANGNGHHGPAPHNSNGLTGVHKIVKDPRVTSHGRFLRKFSLDELPQLINVLRGEMSLIGPRPPLPYEVHQYKEWHKRRLEAHPGITGLWQVAGRNHLSFEEMVTLDLEYIENWSIEMDARIFIKTIPVVLFGRAF